MLQQLFNVWRLAALTGYVGFDKFPKSKELIQKWTNKVRRQNFDPDNYYQGQPQLCDGHFTRECFDKDPSAGRWVTDAGC